MSQTTATSGTPPTDNGLGAPLKQAADPIDRVIRLAPKWTLFVLGACALLVLGALVWAFAGEITTTATSPGLVKDNGYLGVSAPQAGTVESVAVQPGDLVSEGQSLVTFTGGTTVDSPMAGEVSAVYVAEGSVVKANKTLVSVTDPDVPDIVFTLIPSTSQGTISADMPVEMEVTSAPASTYGYLTGRILQVSSAPMTTAQVAETLGMEVQVVTQALGTEPGLLAVVGITPDASTPSHYAWTVGSGPDFPLAQGVQVTVNVILSRQAPIQVVFPQPSATTASSTTGGQG